jgi:PKD repeat protein
MLVQRIESGLYISIIATGALLGACATAPDDAATGETVAAIVDAPPVASFSQVCIDRTCYTDAESSSDDVFIANYSWNWNDGTITSGGSSVSATSHTFALYGPHTITLTVTDSIGQTGSTSHDIRLFQPPTASFTFSCTGHTCNVNASASSGIGSIVHYHWDWDDETTTDTSAVVALHTWPTGGTFHVHLQVTDEKGLTGDVTQAITLP